MTNDKEQYATKLRHAQNILYTITGYSPYRASNIIAREVADMETSVRLGIKNTTVRRASPLGVFDPDPEIAIQEMAKLLPRILKFIKCYNQTSHILYQRQESEHCTLDLRHFLFGAGLLRYEVMCSLYKMVSHCDMWGFGIVSILEAIIRNHRVSIEVGDKIHMYTYPFTKKLPAELSVNYDSICSKDGYYIHYYSEPVKTSLTSADADDIRYTDNFECPQLFPPRRYLTHYGINLTTQHLKINPNINQHNSTLRAMNLLIDTLSKPGFVRAITELGAIYNVDVSVIDKIITYEIVATPQRFSDDIIPIDPPKDEMDNIA